MDGSVRVGGVEVTQQKLNGMYSWLVSHGCKEMPGGYRPDLERFKPFNGSRVESPEEYIHMLCEYPELNSGFRAAFIDPPKRAEPSSPVGILNAAGFPAVVAIHAPTHRHRKLAELDAWAEGYKGPMTPWLWVMGGSDMDRTITLARIAVKAARAMDRELAPLGPIVYERAHDLCERVNSCDMYGPNSKWNAMQGPMTCALLLVDGMGQERTGARELDTLSQIVANRWREALPTVLASETGLSTWAAAHDRTDHARAHTMAAQVANALCGYAQGLERGEAERAIREHVIDLHSGV